MGMTNTSDYRIEITVTSDGAAIALQIIDLASDAIVYEANDLDSTDEAADLAHDWSVTR